MASNQEDDTKNNKNMLLYNITCPTICLCNPTAGNISLVLWLCRHMVCGVCWFYYVNHAMEETGTLECPLCKLPVNA
jgi:hypothetical protein